VPVEVVEVEVVGVVDVVEVVDAPGSPVALLGTVRSGVDFGTESTNASLPPQAPRTPPLRAVHARTRAARRELMVRLRPA
jgi:hypothetical protein